MIMTSFEKKAEAWRTELENTPWYISAVSPSSFRIAHRQKAVEVTYRRIGYYRDRIEVADNGKWKTYGAITSDKQAKDILNGIFESYK